MNNIRFLTVEEVLLMQRHQIETYGGVHGLRDINLVESAVAMPYAMFDGHFLHKDIFEMAAAYLYHLVQNHPFVDGNKRVGALASYIFLYFNGIEFTAQPVDFTEMVYEVAQGRKTKQEITDFFRHHSTPP